MDPTTPICRHWMFVMLDDLLSSGCDHPQFVVMGCLSGWMICCQVDTTTPNLSYITRFSQYLCRCVCNYVDCAVSTFYAPISWFYDVHFCVVFCLCFSFISYAFVCVCDLQAVWT